MPLTRELEGGIGAMCVIATTIRRQRVRNVVLRVKIRPRFAPPRGRPLGRRNRRFAWTLPRECRMAGRRRKEPSEQSFSATLECFGRLSAAGADKAVVHFTGATANFSCADRRNSALAKHGRPPMESFPAEARYKFRNGRLGRCPCGNCLWSWGNRGFF